MKITANYHTHTYRCGHAIGDDESFVKGAIELGLKVLGFSDHVPLKGINSTNMRQDYTMIEDYVKSISNLKDKYKDQIDILIGYECEYIEEYLDEYKELLKNKGIQYLICGQHCYVDNNEQIFYNSYYHNQEMITKYADAICAAIKSGLFAYIAHPDHFMNGYRIWDECAIEQSRKILSCASKYKVPLEINVAGIRFSEDKHKKNAEGKPIENMYPHEKFWELASEYDVKGIIGIDAHRKEDFLDKEEENAIELAKKYNIDLVSKLDI